MAEHYSELGFGSDPVTGLEAFEGILALLTSKWVEVQVGATRSYAIPGRNRLIHGFFWDLPEQYFLASVDGRLRRPRSGWGACSAAAKSRRKVFNLWLLLDDRWAGDTAQVVPVR